MPVLRSVEETFELISLYEARKARERKRKMQKVMRVFKHPGVHAVFGLVAVIALAAAFWGTSFAMKDEFPQLTKLITNPDEIVLTSYRAGR